MEGKHVVDVNVSASESSEPVPEGNAAELLFKVYEDELKLAEAEIQAKTVRASELRTVRASELRTKISALRARVNPSVNAPAGTSAPRAGPLSSHMPLIPYEDDLLGHFLNIDEVKKLFGANETIKYATCSGLVGEILLDDMMKSAKYMVVYLVKNSKVLLYQGQNDLRDGVVSTEAWMKTMKWEGIQKFLEAEGRSGK
ncbi:serine protease [Lithospermum erythrorhizon]|uniref:Serine protease n=1 Tax=Lithospermum erythrorhizon TaxID=34254 RepID=A0AAV3PC09_LITER